MCPKWEPSCVGDESTDGPHEQLMDLPRCPSCAVNEPIYGPPEMIMDLSLLMDLSMALLS